MNAVNSLLRKSPIINKQTNIIRSIQSSSICLSQPPKINATHKVDNLEKRFLVWTGKYKRVDDVPEFVA